MRMFAAAVVACLLGSCGAQVVSFDAAPRHACPGDTVTISWKVKGTASIKLTPPVEGVPSGDVQTDGKLSIKPVRPTMIELSARRLLSSKTAQQEITMDRSALVTAPLADATCQGDVLTSAVDVNISDHLLVTTVKVREGDERSYRVEHLGRHAELGPDGETREFAGTPIKGRWVLATQLSSGEACGTPALPRNLAVETFADCSEGASR